MIVATRPSETTELHTRLLRLGLAAEESRAYFEHLDGHPGVEQAFEERWFGSRSMARVRYFLINFAYRFQAFPQACQALRRWKPSDPRERNILYHWHVQLSDPLYREFTGEVLPRRRAHPEPTIDRTTGLRFVDRKTGGRWAPATTLRMATSLLTCATEAGLCEGSSTVRPLKMPRVSDRALTYLLLLLREVEFAGTLRENPYLASVGIDSQEWEQRVRRLPGVHYARIGDVQELKFEHASLSDWAREAL